MFVNRRRGSPKPANRGAVVTARSAIDRLSRAAQEKTNNALAVQGFPVEYYSYKRLGALCTCGSHLSNIADEFVPTPGVHVLDPEGNASPGHIQAMLQGSVISINRYGARPQVDEADPEEQGLRAYPNPVERSRLQTTKTTDTGDVFGDVVEPSMDLDELLDVNGDRAGQTFLQQQGQSGCGVCLGTGYVGGYNFVNGLRVSYDSQHPWAVNGFALDKSQRPWVYTQVAKPAQALVYIMLPRGMIGVRALRLWNNKQLLQGYVLDILNPDGTYSTLDIPTLLRNADGGVHGVRVTALVDGLSFTHMECVFDTACDPIYVEWNRLTESENPRLPENTEPVSVIISPNVPRVRMYDILVEHTYGRVWKLTTVTNQKDRQSRPYGWDAQARLIQKMEWAQMLSNKMVMYRHAEFSNALVQPVAYENWSGHNDMST
jgi:hypothetical protein